jgi:putative ABC transport system permease protein
MFWILANTRDDGARVTAALDRAFDNAPVPVRAMTERQWQLSFLSMLGNVQALLGSIGLATGFALLLVTANTLAMGARERRGEAALLRVLGFSRGTVAGLVLMEAAIYGVAGAVLGSGVMLVFAKGIAAALDSSQWAGMGAFLVPDVLTFVLALGLGLFLAAASGIVPALGLSRRSIIQLLRDAG